MKSISSIFLTIFVFIFILIIISTYIEIPQKRVCIKVVSLSNGNKPLPWQNSQLLLPNNMTSFIISYTHSVNKGRVKDFYVVSNDNNLVLTKTQFSSYGAGMPEESDWPGQIFSKKDGLYEMSNINRIIPILTMSVGVIADHKIETEQGYYSLADIFQKQTRIKIQYRHITVKEFITDLFCPAQIEKSI